MVGSLFSGHHEDTGWRAPVELPDFTAYPKEAHFGFDLEFYFPGKNIERAVQVGISVCTPDFKKYYLPHGHRGGGNLDENSIKRWAKSNLAGRHLSILNAKGDVRVAHTWGLDLEALDCKIHDPAFKAALLNEERKQFNLSLLSKEVLGRDKLDIPEKDKSHIADMSASEVGAYAEVDAELHLLLDLKQQEEINKQDLTRVCDLEDALIYSTVDMERRGARIDLPKLDQWIREVDLAHQEAILQLYAISGMRINPNSVKDLTKLFNHLGLEPPVREAELGGGITFEEEYLRRVAHPAVRLVIVARKLSSLNTKYLRKYRKLLDYNNILRYNLHQLRTDNGGDGRFGTVTGRYASADVNIQQVMKVESQLEEEEIAAWIIRELFIPADGAWYISADASQVEFRWFAHYSKSAKLIAAYVNDPTMDFHQLVADMLGQKRKDAKHNNFGKLYTMGISKLARKLGLSCTCGLYWDDQWKKSLHASDCRILKAFAIAEEYDRKFPEAKALSNEAMRIAKIRGYVRTVMGRRRRYPLGERLHSALNAIIQGTAADTLKVKLLEIYNNRKFLTFDPRAVVHDEIDGDIWERAREKEFKELLEAPDSRIPCAVPLLWDVVTGKNWRETTA